MGTALGHPVGAAGVAAKLRSCCKANPFVMVACNWVPPALVSVSCPMMERASDGGRQRSVRGAGVSGWEGWGLYIKFLSPFKTNLWLGECAGLVLVQSHL